MKRIPGEPMMELNKVGVGRIMVAMGLLFSAAGIAFVVQPRRFAEASGAESAIVIVMGTIFVLVGLFVVWMARSIMRERLFVTTEGIYHVDGRGPSQRTRLVAEAPWTDITELELVVKHKYAFTRSSADPDASRPG
jgi:hypothetical protein